jgi:ABC-type sulfate/molybdate transport systems ATPase subunit
MTPETGLIVENLSFNYPVTEFKGLKTISFKLPAGSVLVIAGKSGSGKSTLARCIYGAETLSTGQVYWNTKPLLGPERTLMPGMQGIKYMGQDHSLLPFHSVRENISEQLPAWHPDVKTKRVLELLRLLELVTLQHETVQVLSSGQKQRVALARALAQQPELLILDEPFAHLDQLLQEKLSHYVFTRARKIKQTLVFVTHQPEFALRYADRALVLHDGKIAEFGDMQQIYNAPKHIKLAGIFGPYMLLPTQELKGLKSKKEFIFIRPHQFYPCPKGSKPHLIVQINYSRFNGKCFENTGIDENGNAVFFYSAEALICQKELPYCIKL